MRILAAKKDNSMWLVGADEATAKWYFLAENVRKFATNYKKGDEVEIKTEQHDGKYTITYITGKGGGAEKPYPGRTSSPAKTGFTCEACGASLKDDKYKTCYDCSMKKRKEEAASPEGQERQDSIKRQAIGNMTSRTIIGLQGQVDLNNIHEVVRQLYKTYQDLVG